ncbi:MAG TPA: TetR/AcrR family transcriptional regulator [Myxococcales bacterium]|jgi:AcrR family transcriptional regulator
MADDAGERTSARQDRSEATRKQILDAAVQCFAKQGYDRTSTAAIAKAAGVSQGIIFHHFATKEGLFSAVLRTGIDGFKDCLNKAEQSHLAPAEKIQFLLRLMGEMAMAESSRTEIIIRQLFQVQLDPEMVEASGIMGVISTIRDAFEEGRQSGAFGEIDTQTAALSILGIYLANYVGWSALGKSYDFPHALQRGCSMFLEGVTRR